MFEYQDYKHKFPGWLKNPNSFIYFWQTAIEGCVDDNYVIPASIFIELNLYSSLSVGNIYKFYSSADKAIEDLLNVLQKQDAALSTSESFLCGSVAK